MDDRYGDEIIRELININVALSDLKLIVENNTAVVKRYLEKDNKFPSILTDETKEELKEQIKKQIKQPVKRVRKKKDATPKTE